MIWQGNKGGGWGRVQCWWSTQKGFCLGLSNAQWVLGACIAVLFLLVLQAPVFNSSSAPLEMVLGCWLELFLPLGLVQRIHPLIWFMNIIIFFFLSLSYRGWRHRKCFACNAVPVTVWLHLFQSILSCLSRSPHLWSALHCRPSLLLLRVFSFLASFYLIWLLASSACSYKCMWLMAGSCLNWAASDCCFSSFSIFTGLKPGAVITKSQDGWCWQGLTPCSSRAT